MAIGASVPWSGARLQQHARIGDECAVPPLCSAPRDEDREVRIAVVAALGKIRSRATVPALIRRLDDKDMMVRIGAAEVLGKHGDLRAIRPLRNLEGDPFSDVGQAAATALWRLKNEFFAIPDR